MRFVFIWLVVGLRASCIALPFLIAPLSVVIALLSVVIRLVVGLRASCVDLPFLMTLLSVVMALLSVVMALLSVFMDFGL